jgi:CRP-like cAMP-binding protein
VQAELPPGVQVQRVLALRTFSAFRDLMPAEVAVLAENAHERRFPRGKPLYRRGAVIRSLHFVMQGKVGLVRDGVKARELGPQSVIGGLSSLGVQPANEEYVALEETVTLELLHEDVEDVFEDNFRIFLGVIRAIAGAVIRVRRTLGESAGFPEVGSGQPSRNLGELGLVEKIFFLRENMNFAKTRVEALADLAQETVDVKIAEGEALWKVGDPSDHSLMLISGIIDCHSEEPLQRFAFDPGSTVGGLDSLANVPRWFEARARTPLRGLRVETQRLLDVFEDNMEMGIDLLRVIGYTLHELQSRVDAKNSIRPDPGAP